MAAHRLDVNAFRSRLLEWFDVSHRDLPWRRTTDPYRIWVSEVMLQQTQVERVVSYFERFVAAFPTVRSLAIADRDRVLKAWEGLGYYSRARSLHEAAALVVVDHGGYLPRRAADLAGLPGFGPYTSAAVASIAFHEPIAAIDTNVRRVLSRVARVGGDVRRNPARSEIEETAERLLDRDRPGDFNQAMMELGATICRPRQPNCSECPLESLCRARRSGEPTRWPEEVVRPERSRVEAACGIVRSRGRLLVVQRPGTGLLAGLWEFPGARLRDGESASRACERGILEKTAIRVRARSSVGVVAHTFSHFRVALTALECERVGGRRSAGRWLSPDQIDALALTKTARTILAFVACGADAESIPT